MQREQRIKFNKNIYSKKAIQNAMSAFSHLADFKIFNKGSYFEIKINKVDKEIKKELKAEFCNFVLAEIKNNG